MFRPLVAIFRRQANIIKKILYTLRLYRTTDYACSLKNPRFILSSRNKTDKNTERCHVLPSLPSNAHFQKLLNAFRKLIFDAHVNNFHINLSLVHLQDQFIQGSKWTFDFLIDFKLIGFFLPLQTLFHSNLALNTAVIDTSSLNDLSFIQSNRCVDYIASNGRIIMNSQRCGRIWSWSIVRCYPRMFLKRMSDSSVRKAYLQANIRTQSLQATNEEG